jgi:hypothetical protein
VEREQISGGQGHRQLVVKNALIVGGTIAGVLAFLWLILFVGAIFPDVPFFLIGG